jgi:hypothetical protein
MNLRVVGGTDRAIANNRPPEELAGSISVSDPRILRIAAAIGRHIAREHFKTTVLFDNLQSDGCEAKAA